MLNLDAAALRDAVPRRLQAPPAARRSWPRRSASRPRTSSRARTGCRSRSTTDGARFGAPERAGMIFVDGVDIGDVDRRRAARPPHAQRRRDLHRRRDDLRAGRLVGRRPGGHLPRRAVPRGGRRACSARSARPSTARSSAPRARRSARSTCSSRSCTTTSRRSSTSACAAGRWCCRSSSRSNRLLRRRRRRRARERRRAPSPSASGASTAGRRHDEARAALGRRPRARRRRRGTRATARTIDRPEAARAAAVAAAADEALEDARRAARPGRPGPSSSTTSAHVAAVAAAPARGCGCPAGVWLDGVLDQVQREAVQLVARAVDDRRGRASTVELVVAGHAAELGGRVDDDLAEVGRARGAPRGRRRRGPAAAGRRPAGACAATSAARPRRPRRCSPSSSSAEQLEVGQHAGQRRAQLVRGVGDELALAREGGLALLARALQRLEHLVERARQLGDLVVGVGDRARARLGRACARSRARSRSAARSAPARGAPAPAPAEQRQQRAAAARRRRRNSRTRSTRRLEVGHLARVLDVDVGEAGRSWSVSASSASRRGSRRRVAARAAMPSGRSSGAPRSARRICPPGANDADDGVVRARRRSREVGLGMSRVAVRATSRR